MNISKQAFLVSVLTTTMVLLLAYSLELFWFGALSAVGLGFVGWYGLNKKWSWSSDLLLTGAVILVTIGALLRLKLYLLLPGLLSALAAWDLGRFLQRLGDEPVTEKLERRHLNLLVLALISGGILGSVVLIFEVQLSFWMALALGVVLIISLGQIYRLSRSQL